jgi:hypothetical protein
MPHLALTSPLGEFYLAYELGDNPLALSSFTCRGSARLCGLLRQSIHLVLH